MKIGVIADTHISHQNWSLPARLRDVFAGVELILHLGDICELGVLRELQNEYTLTMAVYGECDDELVRRYLEAEKVVEFGRRRIGMIHGHRPERAGLLALLRRLLGPPEEDLPGYLLSRFENVDCILFGHTHRPYNRLHGGVLLFNPGPAVELAGRPPSVGILEISNRAITGKIVPLRDRAEGGR